MQLNLFLFYAGLLGRKSITSYQTLKLLKRQKINYGFLKLDYITKKV